MLNFLFEKWNRPEKGWDPVPAAHAEEYAKNEWENFNPAVIDWIEEHIGPLAGKRVLDLGGGPGQYSVAFAKRGADVIWLDVSARYRNYVLTKAREHGVRLKTFVAYMDEAEKIVDSGSYDLVFNRICWYYSRSDQGFAKTIYRLMSPGGYAYVNSRHLTFTWKAGHAITNAKHFLNKFTFLKAGHPHPPKGRIARLFCTFPVEYMVADFSRSTNDVVFIKKSTSEGADA